VLVEMQRNLLDDRLLVDEVVGRVTAGVGRFDTFGRGL
jgi:hypothetical protein